MTIKTHKNRDNKIYHIIITSDINSFMDINIITKYKDIFETDKPEYQISWASYGSQNTEYTQEFSKLLKKAISIATKLNK